MPTRVLLTGASGFIGSHVLDRLIARHDSVRVLALPDTVEQVRHRAHVELIVGSLVDESLLNEVTKGVQVVYHIAGALPNQYKREIIQVNVYGTENLLRASALNRVRRFVFTSSTAVYSPIRWRLTGSITENAPLRTPSQSGLSVYSQSKIEAEKLIQQFYLRSGLEYVILRPPFAYGPGLPVVTQLLQQILNHPRLTLFSTGNSRNLQWVHVCDLAEAVELAGTQAAATNHIFNIAGRELFSLRDLMTIARLYTGEGLRKTAFSPWDRSGDNSGLKYDLSKAYNRLGFMPRIKLRDGIEEILVTFGST